MNNLEKTAQLLQQQFNVAPFTLSSLPGSPSLNHFFDKVLHEESIVFAEKPDIQMKDERLTLRGVCSFLTFEKVELSLELHFEGTSFTADMTVSLKNGDTILIPGMPLLAMEDIALVYTMHTFDEGERKDSIPSLPTDVSSRITGKIPFSNDISIPVALEKEYAHAPDWRLSLSRPVSLNEIKELTALIPGFDPAILPNEVNSLLQNIVLKNLFVAIDFENNRVNVLGASLGQSKAPWTIVGDLALHGACLSITVTEPADPVSRSVHVAVFGDFVIETENIRIDLPIRAAVSKRELSLCLGGSTPARLPGLAEITSLLFGSSIETSLPPQLSSIGGIIINEFRVIYDTGQKTVSHICLNVEGEKEWTVVDKFLSIKETALFVKLEYPLVEKSRKLSLGISGVIDIAGIEILVGCRLSERGWLFIASSGDGETISIKRLLETNLKETGFNLPSAMPDVILNSIEITVNATTGEFSFKSASSLENLIPIHNKRCALSLGIDTHYNPEKKEKKLTGHLSGALRIGEVDFLAELNLGDPALALKLKQGERLNFREVSEFLLGKELFNVLPEDLTHNLKGIEIIGFDSNINFENRGITLNLSAALNNITFGSDDLLIEKTNLVINLEVSAIKTYCRIEVSGKGNIGSAVIFEDCQFIFEYDQWNGHLDWSLSGLFHAEILGHELKIKAAFTDKEHIKTLTLQAIDPFPAIVFPGVGSFELDDFTLMVEKKADQKTAWGLSTTFQLETEADIFDLRSGTVTLINDADKCGLKLLADSIDMKISDLDYLPWFALDQPELDLIYYKPSKQWSCHGETGFTAHSVPDMLNRIFPVGEIKTVCTINDKKAQFSITLDEKDKGLIKIPAPMDMGDFGNAYIGVTELTIDLLNGGSLTAKLKFGLPKGLNVIFQPEPEAEDKLEIFRVYDPDNSENPDKELLGLNLIISAKDGLLCQLDQSPFIFFEFTEDESGRKIIDFDLKEFGHFSLDVPLFSLQADGSFKAAGGFDIKKDIQFPLTPFKFLLENAKFDEAARVLPNGIPIKGVNFYSEEKGFDCGAFFDLFLLDGERAPIPDWLREGFEIVDDIMNRLPKEFLKYGNIEIPQHLLFNIDFSAEGSLNFQLSVKDPAGIDEAVPLKFLLPSFPYFTGIELYSISFGELFGGALLRIDLDVQIDCFDLPSLLAALLISYDDLAPEIQNKLPDPRNFQNTFVAQNLLIAIFYESGIPIPIPLFYDKLGVIYKGVSGVQLESCFSFPKPPLNVKDFILIFSELKGFFTENDRRINLEKVENEITFGNFTIGPNYFRFPKYISTEEDDPSIGKLLGTKDGFTISPTKLIGALLNAMKFQSVNDLIQTVELDRRVDDFDLNIFDLLRVHCEYAFTTPFEFIDCAYEKLPGFSKNQAEEFIKILPPKNVGLPEKIDGEYRYRTIPITEDTQGLIIFLKGELNIADALLFDTGFGLVATNEGFGMAMNFDGAFTDIFNIHMKGIVGIKSDGEFLLEGDSQLEILSQNILYGHSRFSNEGFIIEAKAGDGPITAAGLLKGEFTNDIFLLQGEVSMLLFNLQANGEAKFLFTKEDKLVYLHGNVEIGNFIKLEATFKTFVNTDLAGMQLSLYGRLSELLELKLEGTALLDQTTLQAKGDAWIKILDQEIIEAKFEYLNNYLAFEGHLNLFPHNEHIEIKSNITGLLANDKFELTGHSGIIIVGYKFAAAALLITDREFLFATKLFDLKTVLMLQKEDQGFKLFGAMSPVILGNLLQITRAEGAPPPAAYDLGGPSIEISTVPGTAGFAMNGRISLLGIETSPTIEFSENGFLFDVRGKIFNLVEAKFRVSGRDFNDSKNIVISGTIETGDLEGQATIMVNDLANDINRQLQIACGTLDDAKAWLSEKQQKVNHLNSEINKNKIQIRNLKNQIEAKKNWFNRLHWTVKPWKLAELGLFVTAKGLAIAGLYAAIGVLEGLKLTVMGLLELAKVAVDTAKVALIGTAAINTALADMSKKVIHFSGQILTIHEASFTTCLNSVCEGATKIDLKGVTFLGKDIPHISINFNFLHPQLGGKSLADSLTATPNALKPPSPPSGLRIT